MQIKFYPQRLSLVLLAVFISLIAMGQNREKQEAHFKSDKSIRSYTFNEKLGTPSFISFNSGFGPGTNESVAAIKKYIGLENSVSEIRLIRKDLLKNNIVIERYKQFYKGIIVEHSSYVIMSRGGKILSIAAESYPITESFSTFPLQTPDAALSRVLNFVQAKKYAWEALEDDKKRFAGNAAAQQILEAMKKQYTPKAELVIAKDVYGDGQAHLAYKFDIYAVEPLGRYKIYADAQTGKILLRDAVIKHIDKQKTKKEIDPGDKLTNYQFYGLTFNRFMPQLPGKLAVTEVGTALTRYSGTRQIYTTKVTVPLTGKPDPNNSSVNLMYSGVDPRVPIIGPVDVYILKDQTRGEGVETYDLNGVGGIPLSIPSLQGTGLAFVDKDNIWQDEADFGVTTQEDLIRGATADGSNGANEAFNDDIAIDAHWGAEMVYDYWLKRHNRASFDNKNGAIKSYIHYGPAYDNAFWNGSTMTYGDGSGTAAAGFRPLVSLDVCGHEIGHGVCSFTSDLVYEKESGAMNEGLSDIWAAAMENFVDDSVKFSGSPTYQYFQVGENIAPDNVGIRRMDYPKDYGDPDTYGGQNWKDVNCTPSLANDQCGVHSNSGVLNKWFYLMVMGPGQTTGSPSRTDDGVADLNSSTNNGGNAYGSLPGFIGIGFEQAEDITYLMEQMLTPNATYADARDVSILAAEALFGDCSQQERTVTDAWFGVGVGAAFGVCTAPLLTVVPTVTTVGEGAPGYCPRYTDVKVNANLTVGQTSSTSITFSVTPGTLGAHEYQLLTPTITFAANETGLKSVAVLRIFDDAVVESDETITINASAASVGYSNSDLITVTDNDNSPTIGGVYPLLSENFEGTAAGSLPANWTQINKTSSPPIQWKVRTNGTIPLTWAGNRAIVEQTVLTGQATYDQLTEAQIILRTPIINGTGLDSLKLEFTYQAGGEPACNPACDYGKIMYSYDGTSFTAMFPEDTVMYNQLTDRRAVYAIPQQLSNTQFYIGFLWYNDANAGTSASLTIDDVLVTGQGKRISSDSLSGVSEPIPSSAQEGTKPSFLYSRYDASLLSKITEASLNLGCVKDTLIESGVGSIAFSGGQRSRKVFEIIPSQNSNATYTLTLYFTTQELSTGFGGANPSTLRLLKSNAATIDQSNSSNSITVTPTFEDHSSDGYYAYTYTFTGFSKFALVTPGVTLPINLLDFTVQKKGRTAQLQWRTATEINSSHFEIERSADGQLFTKLKTIAAAGNAAGVSAYNAVDEYPVTGVNYYRLKTVDKDGKYAYSPVRTLTMDKALSTTLYPNPAQTSVTVALSEVISKGLVKIINHRGQVVRQIALNNTASLQIPVSNLPAGVYIVNISGDQFLNIQKLEIKR